MFVAYDELFDSLPAAYCDVPLTPVTIGEIAYIF